MITALAAPLAASSWTDSPPRPAAEAPLSVVIDPVLRGRLWGDLWDCLDLSRPWAVLHPGASAPVPFAAAADRLAGLGWQLLFTGGEEDGARVDAVRERMRAPSLSWAGLLGPEALAALLSLAPLLLSEDPRAVRLARAVGAPAAAPAALEDVLADLGVTPSARGESNPVR
jgi:hypothetical protein